MTRRVGRWTVLIILAFCGVLATASVIAAIVYSPTYVIRVLTMRESSQIDYLEHFPVRTLHASTRPFRYPVEEDPTVRSRLEAALAVDDFDSFMDETATQALIVIEDDVVVFEQYANDADRSSMLTSFSVAKSFDSTLVGIAIDEGLIESVDEPITSYLPELVDDEPKASDITIAHLLTMASGLEFAEMRWGLFNGDDPLSTYHPDQRAISLDAATRVVDPPGEYFRYNKYHPQLLGMILERATGMSVSEYTQTRLWEPLGMEFDGQWTLDSTASGFEKMEAGLNARAIDFAKLGSLFLAGGEWNGSRIVSSGWVDAAVGPGADRDQPSHYPDDFGQWVHQAGNGWYGYMWYGRARSGSEFDYFAEGDHGQFVYVSPSRDTVVVRIGSEFGVPGGDWIDAFYAFCS